MKLNEHQSNPQMVENDVEAVVEMYSFHPAFFFYRKWMEMIVIVQSDHSQYG